MTIIQVGPCPAVPIPTADERREAAKLRTLADAPTRARAVGEIIRPRTDAEALDRLDADLDEQLELLAEVARLRADNACLEASNAMMARSLDRNLVERAELLGLLEDARARRPRQHGLLASLVISWLGGGR